jgi:hypothetical protein
MLLKYQPNNHRAWTGAGMFLLAAGILLTRFSPALPTDFLQGALDGLGVTFIAASIVFSLRGVTLYRRRHS